MSFWAITGDPARAWIQAFRLRGCQFLPFNLVGGPFRLFISSSPLLNRNDIRRSEPTIAFPFPRRFPVLLREDQFAPEGILIPMREVSAHDWWALVSLILYSRVRKSSKRDLMFHSLGHVHVPQLGTCAATVTTATELVGYACRRE